MVEALAFKILQDLSPPPIPHALCSSYMASLILLKPETSLIRIVAHPPADNHIVHSLSFFILLLLF